MKTVINRGAAGTESGGYLFIPNKPIAVPDKLADKLVATFTDERSHFYFEYAEELPVPAIPDLALPLEDEKINVNTEINTMLSAPKKGRGRPRRKAD